MTPSVVSWMASSRTACAPGSALVLSHTVPMDIAETEIAGVAEVMQRTTLPDLQYRTHDDIGALFHAYQLVAPACCPARGAPNSPSPNTKPPAATATGVSLLP